MIRMVSKDLVTTNPPDVAHIERIEAAIGAKGTEIDIQIVDLPSSGYADALSVMLLSGDIPDLIYFQGGDAKMVEQGILEDLTPWIGSRPTSRPRSIRTMSSGSANYPYLLYIYPPRMPQPVIRKDWLEKTGLPAPTTVDEYVALFRAIKDGDLDGDGVANTYGVTTADNTNELDFDLQPGVRRDRHLDEGCRGPMGAFPRHRRRKRPSSNSTPCSAPKACSTRNTSPPNST